MSYTNLKRIEDALAILYEEGLTHIKPECQKDIPRYQAIGLAIASVTDSAKNILNLAYSALEDHNYHDLCAVIEWAYPLYDQTFYTVDLARLSRKMNKSGVTVNLEWDAKTESHKTKKINVRIVFDDVTDE
jgi:hypothetical protein